MSVLLEDLFKVVEFDIRGTNPANTFVRERHLLADKKLNYIVPDGTPYFAEPNLVRVYDEAGRILVLGKDYTMEDPFIPFCEKSGRDIKQFILLSPKVLKDNEFVEINYQSIGAFFLPRTKLDEIVDIIKRGNGQTPYDRITHKPKEFPVSLHIHSVKTEVMGWFELIWFMHYLGGVVLSRPKEPLMDLDPIIDEAYSRLKSYRDEVQARLKSHDTNYANPHGYTRELFNLSNVQNFRFATVSEHLTINTNINNLYATPAGVGQLAKQYEVDNSRFMKNGIIPYSIYNYSKVNNPVTNAISEGVGEAYNVILSFATGVKSMFKGTSYAMESGTKYFNVGVSRPNGGFYLYATVNLQEIGNVERTTGSYLLSPTKLCKSNRLLLIGRVYNIYNEEWRFTPNEALTYLADYAISKEKDGGIIPVITGNTGERGTFKFFRKNELLK